jgi:hypothetical protein
VISGKEKEELGGDDKEEKRANVYKQNESNDTKSLTT